MAYTSRHKGEYIDEKIEEISILGNEIDNLEETVNLHSTDIADMNNTVLTHTNQIAGLQGEATALKGKTKYYSAPNLLDNWCFINPVNQRGQTSAINGYFIDRWISIGGTSYLDTNYIRINNGIYFHQRIDSIKYNIFNGMKLTASILTTENKLITGTATINVEEDATFILDDNYDLLWWAGGNHSFVIHSKNSNTGVIAAKLELGDSQTLAHLEGDTWVLNEIPNYGEELRKCQRYRKTVSGCFSGTYMADGMIALDVKEIADMRTRPVLESYDLGSRYAACVDGLKTVSTEVDIHVETGVGKYLYMTNSGITTTNYSPMSNVFGWSFTFNCEL